MRRFLAISAAYAALVLAFFSPVVFGTRILAYDDALKHYLPSFTVGPVLWSSAAGGYPIYIDIQNMAFFPPKLLFQTLGWIGLPLRTSYNLFALTPLIAAATFTHLYVLAFTRRQVAAAVAGTVVALSSPLLHFVEWPDHGYGAAMLPLLVFVLERMRTDLTWRTRGLLAMSVTLTLLSGYPPMSIFIGLTAAAYAAVRGARAFVGAWRYYVAAVTCALFGLGIAAIQLLPTALAFIGTVGTSWALSDFNDGAYAPSDYLRLLFPFVTGGGRALYGDVYFGEPARILVYLGVAPLVLAAIGMFNSRKMGVPWVFWGGAALYFLTLALGDATPIAYLTYQLPIIRVGHEWPRLFVVVGLAVAVFAGIGTAALLDDVRRWRIWLPAAAVGGTFIVALTVLQIAPMLIAPMAAGAQLPGDWSFSPFVNPAFAVPLMLLVTILTVTALAPLGSVGRRFATMAVPLLVLVDLASFGYAHEWRSSSPQSSDVLNRPANLEAFRNELMATGQRIASYRSDVEDGAFVAKRQHPDDRAGLRQEIGRFWGFDTLEYFGKWTTPEFSALTDRLDTNALANGSVALDMLAVRYLLVYTPRDADDAEATSHHLARTMLERPQAWRELGQIGRSRAFENLGVLPRAWVAHQSLVVDDDEAREAIRSGRLPDGQLFDRRRTVLVDEAGHSAASGTDALSRVDILERGATRYRLLVNSSQPGMLVLSDTYHPSWQAWIDGASVPVYRANLILRAVPVPAGQTVVELRFAPQDFYAGAAISAASLAMGLALLWREAHT